MIEYDRIDDDGGGSGGKSVEELLKAEKLQKPEKFAKTIGLEELSVLISDTRLVVAKISTS